MRVMFLVHAHPELQPGGTEIFTRDLFRTLRSRDVSGLLVAGTAAHQRPTSPGTPFQVVGDAADEVLLRTSGFDPFFLSQTDLHGVGRPLADLLREQQPQIVHIHHLLTLGVETVALIRRSAPEARIVMTLHDYYPICAHDGQMVTSIRTLCQAASPDACRRCFPERALTDFKLRQLHIARAFDQIDHFIAPSHFLRDRFIAWGLDGARISVVPNGLPARTPTPARSAPRRDSFAFFGHINKFKGATVALEASAILSSQGVAHTLSLHGGTDYQAEDTLARFAAARDKAPDATYRGPYRRADFAQLIAPVDWVIFPSEWWENAPLVINEAFQHWRPVISSDIGGALELVHDEHNGLNFPVGNARALADVMRRAIADAPLWQRLVNGIIPPVSIENSATRHQQLYAELLAAPTRQLAA